MFTHAASAIVVSPFLYVTPLVTKDALGKSIVILPLPLSPSSTLPLNNENTPV